MSLVIRETREGRRAPGYLIYLAAGLSAVAAVLALHGRAGGRPRRARRARSRGSDVRAITEPAAAMSPIRVGDRPPPPEARSYRLGAGGEAAPAEGPSAGAGSFDAIGEALSPPPAAAPSAAGPAYAALAPAFADEGEGAGEGTRRPGGREAGAGLLGYRDRSADPGPARPPAPPAPRGGPVPRGTLIRVVLLTTVDTSNPAAVLQFAASRSLVFNHRIQLPFGTRFLGRLAGAPARDRLNLAADEIVFPDGREAPVSARAVEADDEGADIRPGVAASFVPPPAWAQIAPYAAEAVGGYLGLLESRAERTSALGPAGVAFGAPADASGPLDQASAQAVQDFARARLQEIEERYASHYLVRAGAECWLQLDADLDLAAPGPEGPARR